MDWMFIGGFLELLKLIVHGYEGKVCAPSPFCILPSLLHRKSECPLQLTSAPLTLTLLPLLPCELLSLEVNILCFCKASNSQGSFTFICGHQSCGLVPSPFYTKLFNYTMQTCWSPAAAPGSQCPKRIQLGFLFLPCSATNAFSLSPSYSLQLCPRLAGGLMAEEVMHGTSVPRWP